MSVILGNRVQELSVEPPEGQGQSETEIRMGPPGLLLRLFQMVPAWSKVPISLKSKPIQSWEKHEKTPCPADFLRSSGHRWSCKEHSCQCLGRIRGSAPPRVHGTEWHHCTLHPESLGSRQSVLCLEGPGLETPKASYEQGIAESLEDEE